MGEQVRYCGLQLVQNALFSIRSDFYKVLFLDNESSPVRLRVSNDCTS